MNLQKRSCSTKLKLTPYGADILQVIWDINEDHHIFYPSAVMGDQFNLFMDAVYTLYDEESDSHKAFRRRYFEYHAFPYYMDNSVPYGHIRRKTSITWDFEGIFADISFERTGKWGCHYDEYTGPDPVKVIIDLNGHYEYIIDGKDLCYAIGKACTKALKTYGIRGYHRTTALDESKGDWIDLEQLLFFKAYALNAWEVRKLKVKWENSQGWEGAKYTPFDKELELLLFDM